MPAYGYSNPVSQTDTSPCAGRAECSAMTGGWNRPGNGRLAWVAKAAPGVRPTHPRLALPRPTLRQGPTVVLDRACSAGPSESSTNPAPAVVSSGGTTSVGKAPSEWDLRGAQFSVSNWPETLVRSNFYPSTPKSEKENSPNLLKRSV